MFAKVKKSNKRIAIKLAIFSAVAAGTVVFTLLFTATRPKHIQYCAKCHNNVSLPISFNNTCKNPLSKDVTCIECHTHKNKGTSVMAVEIRDEHCTTESCHPLDKLTEKSVPYKTIKPFQHKTHCVSNRNQITENLKPRCISCHASLGGDKHFGIDEKTCNTCHFIDTQKPLYTQDKMPISECILCHDHVKKTVDIYDKTFNHDTYEGNKKVSCTDCHFNTIQGNGKVDKQSCYQCHSTIANNFNSASDMHYNHIVKRKTTCTPCHTSVTHGWIKLCSENQRSDQLLTPAADYNVQNMIMMGVGGVGVKCEPDPMYLATLNCSACHKDKQRYANVTSETCNNCHEKGFDKILSEQMCFITSEMRLLKNLLTKAKGHHIINTNRVINEAQTNFNLIKEDGSLGVHNIKYVKALLYYSITNLRQIVK
ncbi:MAG TPA: hypothetical protein ACFYEK_03935 [Candidatus Wunengus sp. YC60]|uniref:hypothetical protein n=1 Tax=Candidatus Wunengus sp. YC60 TaxID=3367697 RepID=UPI00402946D5